VFIEDSHMPLVNEWLFEFDVLKVIQVIFEVTADEINLIVRVMR
jgi:hypothetical protein